MCFHILYWMGPTNGPERTSVYTSAGRIKLTVDLFVEDEKRKGLNCVNLLNSKRTDKLIQTKNINKFNRFNKSTLGANLPFHEVLDFLQ